MYTLHCQGSFEKRVKTTLNWMTNILAVRTNKTYGTQNTNIRKQKKRMNTDELFGKKKLWHSLYKQSQYQTKRTNWEENYITKKREQKLSHTYVYSKWK
jgi:hypothetical protein